MSLIQVSNLTFAYNGSYENVFENVRFQLDTDWKLGFIGRNGRGKTTFLKLLCGEYEYQGNITAAVRFEYFPFEVVDSAESAVEIVLRGCPDALPWLLVRELSLLEAKEEILYRPFKSLSQGEQTKVMLAALFLRENRFLLIDEPTNHLDMYGREVVSRYLNKKSGFILVSHDRAFLDGCIDHVLSLNKTGIAVQRGNCSSWLENYERQVHFELAENEKLNGEISRLQAAARQTSEWSGKLEKTKNNTRNAGLRPDRGYIGHKSAKMMKRTKNIEKRRNAKVEEKLHLLKNSESTQALKLAPAVYPARRLVFFRDVSVQYAGRQVCSSVSFTVENGDRVALCGKNGSGKSGILQLICGSEIMHSGIIEVGSRMRISYVPQNSIGISGDLSDFALRNQIDESLFKAILRKLDFSRAQFEKDISAYSEGQKKKVLLAKSLCENAHLYIWDEPLNYMDIFSRMQIESLLLEFKPTILFVEHDSSFCARIATKQVLL